jgi:predicted secreted protein
MANKYAAYGAIIEIGGPASDTASYNAVDGVTSLGIPSDSADEIDVTSHDSAGGRKEYINGLIDSEDLSITLFYDAADAQHEELRAAAGGVAQHVKVTISGPASNTIHTFSALVKSFAIELPHDGPITATVGFRRTGADDVS